MLRMIRTILIAAATAGMAAPAAGQEVNYIASHRDWHSFQYTENGNPVCYAASKPTREEGNYSRRDDVFVLVTHRPAEGSRDVISFVAGYPFGDGAEVTVTIGSRSFQMFTQNDEEQAGRAWNYDANADNEMIQAMINGSSMTVRGASSRGTQTTDTYSLLGFTAAHEDINKACGP